MLYSAGFAGRFFPVSCRLMLNSALSTRRFLPGLCRLLALGTVLCGVLLVSTPARGQEPQLDEHAFANSPLLMMSPEAAKLPAPDWIKPGTRITFYGMAGTTPQGGYTLDKDANGEWEDPSTGERYSKNEAVGSGGHGFSQWDIIAVGKHAVALTANMYTIIHPGQPPQLLQTPLGGWTGVAAGPADLWVHPDLLQKAQQFHTNKFFILRGNYAIGDRNYSCLCTVNRGQGSYSSYAYDLKSGVLISSTVTSSAQITPLYLPNEEVQPGNMQTTIAKFISVRQFKMPGIDGKNPPWVRTLRAMHFVGQCQYVNPYDANIRMNFPARIDIVLGKRGDNWCAYTLKKVTQVQGAPPEEATLNGMCGPGGALWIDPAALVNLQPRQVLDEDPVTHIRTYVADADPAKIAIATEGPGISGQAVYNRQNGMLQMILSRQSSSGITTTLQLEGTE